MQQHTAAIIIIVLLVLLKIYRHAQSELRFQKFVKWRLRARTALLFFFGVVLLSTGCSNPVRILFDGIGILLGGAIACYSIRTSVVEWRENDCVYRQNPWICKSLFVVFAGSLLHKGYEDIFVLVDNAPFTPHGQTLAEYAREPSLTAFIFILIAYYIVFDMLIIRKVQQWKLSNQRDEPSAG